MTRGTVTTRDRSVIAACAIGAVATAMLIPLVWRGLVEHPIGGSVEVAMWVTTMLAPVPACLALAAVVLTARAVGTVIAVVCGVAALVANLQGLDAFRSMLGVEDYLSWLLWAVLLGCALLGADALAWRLGSFTMASGTLAGVAVAVLQTVVKSAMYVIGRHDFSLPDLEAAFWVREYVVPAVMLVLAGTVAGAVVQRVGVRQETAGRG